MFERSAGLIEIAIAVGVALVGCTSSRTLPDDDASTSADAAVAADASTPGDAARPRDATPATDGGSSTGLLAALRCHLSERGAVEAILRQVACNDRFTTATDLLRRWDHLELGRPYTDSYGGETKACEEWRCLATATSCEDAASCRYLGYTERRVGCETGDAHCDGSIRTICSGGSFRHAFDCADVGATCVDGYCQVGDCRFGPFGIANCRSTMGPGIGLGCVVDTCEAECIPTGYGEVYYGYCGPRRDAPSVVCDGDGVLTIDMLRSEDLSYDCRAHGYSGCDHRGCTP